MYQTMIQTKLGRSCLMSMWSGYKRDNPKQQPLQQIEMKMLGELQQVSPSVTFIEIDFLFLVRKEKRKRNEVS